MKTRQALTGIAVAMILCASAAMGQTIPDLTGIWSSTLNVIIDGPAPMHPQGSPDIRVAGPNRVRTVREAIMRIEGQEGRSFGGQ